jgi:hypothetical protein
MAKIYQKNLNNGNLTKEAQERWWIDYTTNDRRRRRVSVGIKKDAEDLLKTVEGDKVRGLLRIEDNKGDMTIAELIDEYIDERRKDSSNPNSFIALGLIKKDLGAIRLRNLSQKMIMAKRDEWLAKPNRGEQNINKIQGRIL